MARVVLMGHPHLHFIKFITSYKKICDLEYTHETTDERFFKVIY